MTETKNILLNYRRTEEISEAVKNCYALFPHDESKAMFCDSIGLNLISNCLNGANYRIPAVTDDVYVSSMGQGFSITHKEKNVVVESLVKMIFELADIAYYAENSQLAIKIGLEKYQIA